MSPGSMPRAGWLATGVAVGAAASAAGLPVAAVAIAGLLAVSVASVMGRRHPAWARVLTAAGVGVVLVALRIAVGPGAAPLAPLPDAPGPWHAVVESMGSPRDGSQTARLRLETDAGDVVVAATLPPYPELSAGAAVEVNGRLRPPPEDDPYGEYLRRTGASGSLDARMLRLLVPSAPSLQAARDAAGDALQRSLPEPEAGLAAGILIGLRERVDRALAADFATAGVSHVVAISGWNIAIVAGLVGAAMRGRSRRLVSVVVLLTVAGYVVAAGASASVVRAAVMAAVVLVARETGRAGRAAAALGAAAAILLLVEPALVGDAGFRLSVLATAGLLAWATPWGERIGRLGGGRVPRWLAESLGISLAAQAATLPDVLATFGRLSLVSPVVNLAVVPLVPVAMAGGVLALAGGGAALAGAPGLVATLAGLPGWLVLHVVVLLVRVGAGLPFAAVALPDGVAQPTGVVAAVVILAGPGLVRWARKRWRSRGPRVVVRAPTGGVASGAPGRPSRPAKATPSAWSPARRFVALAALIVGALCVAGMGDAAGRSTRITVLDIGQGDAILVEARSGARMLVDGGPDPERVLVALDGRIPPWDRRIDVVVLTHPHEDHVAGLVRVLDRYRVGRVFEPGMRGPGPSWAAWTGALHDGPPDRLLSTGATLRLGEISLRVLWPDAGTVPLEPPDVGREINHVSIVLLGSVNGHRFLLTGDAEDDVDPTLLQRGLPTVDLLKVAHHGSRTATSQPLLDALRPRVAVVSVGAGNRYGHPARETLARLTGIGARVLRTDRDGSVTVELPQDGLRVTTSGARAAAGARGSGTAARWRDRTARADWAVPTGYDPFHADPRTLGRRPPALVAGPAPVVPAARVRRRGRRGVAGGEDDHARRARGSAARRERSAPPRRRQAARGGDARAPARRGVGGVAQRARDAGARARGP